MSEAVPGSEKREFKTELKQLLQRIQIAHDGGLHGHQQRTKCAETHSQRPSRRAQMSV